MSNPQLSLYSGFEPGSIIISVTTTGVWYWRVRTDEETYYSDGWFNNAADAEQDLITFLKTL